MNNSTKSIILQYWHSWQKPDWSEMRSCLADELNFGGQNVNADDFVIMCQQGNPWENVQLLSSFFTVEGGALLYEGFDTGNKKVIRVGEFIQVRDSKVVASIASFGTGIPPQ